MDFEDPNTRKDLGLDQINPNEHYTTVRFDLIGAYKQGHKEHPQRVMEKIGFKIIKFQGIPIADCAMMQVVGNPDLFPEFVEIVDFKFDL